jgi:hypothetical protein
MNLAALSPPRLIRGATEIHRSTLASECLVNFPFFISKWNYLFAHVKVFLLCIFSCDEARNLTYTAVDRSQFPYCSAGGGEAGGSPSGAGSAGAFSGSKLGAGGFSGTAGGVEFGEIGGFATGVVPTGCETTTGVGVIGLA